MITCPVCQKIYTKYTIGEDNLDFLDPINNKMSSILPKHYWHKICFVCNLKFYLDGNGLKFYYGKISKLFTQQQLIKYINNKMFW